MLIDVIFMTLLLDRVHVNLSSMANISLLKLNFICDIFSKWIGEIIYYNNISQYSFSFQIMLTSILFEY